jgi:hypothetical protein
MGDEELAFCRNDYAWGLWGIAIRWNRPTFRLQRKKKDPKTNLGHRAEIAVAIEEGLRSAQPGAFTGSERGRKSIGLFRSE